MKADNIRVLSEEQTKVFDVEYVTEEMWPKINNILNSHMPTSGSDFLFLDIGGGNGVFSDSILEMYPKSQGYLVDNSQYLLNQNKKNSRKILIEGSVNDLSKLIGEVKFDFIFMNWVLHHFVKNGYLDTIENQRAILHEARKLLKDNGRLIVIENLPQGIFGETLCTFIINKVTSSKVIEPFVKKMGGNTAGIGVCFLGKNQWIKQFKKVGLFLDSVVTFGTWDLNPIKKVILTIKSIKYGIFSLKKNI
jgi:ubiquinone/menaquinone biosynthesis C-methylase UbiE